MRNTLKVNVVLSLLMLGCIVPNQAIAQIIKGYQSKPELGMRWQWKAFPESVSVNTGPTGLEWVKLTEQAVYGNAMRVYVPKGKTAKTADVNITIDFLDYKVQNKDTDLDQYIILANESAKFLCDSRKDAYQVKTLKKSNNEIIIQMNLRNCQKNGTEIRRIFKGDEGLHSIFFESKNVDPDKLKLLQMREVVESATIISTQKGAK